MPEIHEHLLEGCRPEPLMAYLKALGVLRLVGEQADHGARGGWRQGVFELRTQLSEEELRSFFLDRYIPTPVVAPWNGGSGFYPKDKKDGIDAVAASTAPRLASYRDAVKAARRLLKEVRLDSAPKDDAKLALLQACRRTFPEAALPWLDATFAIADEQARYAAVLGTGGNDGRLDFTNNHMQRLASVLGLDGTPPDRSKAWLDAALFAQNNVALQPAAVGQFNPAGAGGANATEGFEAPASLVNPWDFVLMIEGAMLLAGSVARRLGDFRGKAAFPFSVDPTSSGWGSIGEAEGSSGRAELWLPLWSRPASLAELRHVLAEGRAQVGRRQARDGLDVARAAVSLGVDRGIEAFQRYGFLKRNGLAYVAAPLGRVPVTPRPSARLLGDADRWLDNLRSSARAGRGPATIPSALRSVEAAAFEYCLRGGDARLQGVLESLGEAERAVARVAKPDEVVRQPLQDLSHDWLRLAEPGAGGVEVRLASALSSVHHPDLGGLRVHLEPVGWERGRYRWTERTGTVTWAPGDLAVNLGRVLRRRLLDAEKEGSKTPSLAAARAASLGDIEAFLRSPAGDPRLERLLWGLHGLRPVKGPVPKVPEPAAPSGGVPPTIPRPFALLKLLFLPFPLRWGRDEVTVPPSAEVLRLLDRGDLGGACAAAERVLRGRGLPVIASAGGRAGLAAATYHDPHLDARRLTAALLMPIHPHDAEGLAKLVLRQPAEPMLRS